jgi:seryl-tRNA synthetase
VLDIHFIREHADDVRHAIEVKQVELDLDVLLEQHQAVVRQRQALDELNRERNENAKRVPKASPEERESLIQRGRAIGGEIREAEQALREAEACLSELLLLVPNIPDPGAPIGGEEDFAEVRRWGEPREWQPGMRDQVDLLETNGWAEFERPSRVAGARNYMLKGQAVLLEMALWRLAMDLLVSRGMTPITVPSMARESAFLGTGHFPTGRDQVYYLPDDDLYLSGTAEVLANALHAGELLNKEALPITYAAFSPCFRREAGSAGRDVRGLIRVHQFTKIEQYVLCRADREESARWFDTILGNAEAIVQALEVPYRIIMTATADMGVGKVRMWDIESWVPSEGRYRETHSCSELYDWQARRADLRYRDAESGRPKFGFTLNNTALATPRFLVPLLENHQLPDGDVAIPQALRPYLLGAETLRSVGKDLSAR